MAIFKVGQRVKLVRPVEPENYGIEGTIIAFENWPKGTISSVTGTPFTMDVDCVVLWDTVFYLNREGSAQHTSQLEPIQDQDDKSKYDGNEVIDWDECIFDRNGKYKIPTVTPA